MKGRTLLKNIGFGSFMYWDLRKIQKYKRGIRKYRREGDVEKEREQILLMEHTWACSLMEKTGADIHIEGRENIPSGPMVIVANHQSYTDIPILAYVLSDTAFGFVAKEELKKLPLFGALIADVRSVFIKRGDPRESLRAIEQGIELLKQGFCLGIFPEGTRSRGPVMGEFKKGSLRLATKPGMPILPITISGSYKCFEQPGTPTGAVVDVFIHPPIETKGMDRKEASNLAAVVQEQIHIKLLELQARETLQNR